MILKPVLNDIVKTLKGVRQAPHSWIALCPFHQETTPNFTIDELGRCQLLEEPKSRGLNSNVEPDVKRAAVKRRK